MKKVLIITDLFPNKYRPYSEVFVQHQVNELAKSYEVAVIATSFPHKQGIELDTLPTYKVTYIYFPIFKNSYLSSLLFYRFYAIPEVKRVITNWRPDLIHVHDCRHVPELILLNNCLRLLTIPMYLTVHNIRTHPSMIKSSHLKWFYLMCFNKSYSGWTHIFTVNEKLKDVISKRVSGAMITNIGNAIGPLQQIDSTIVDKYRSLLSDKSYKIIAVGNLKAEKGFDLLIDSVKALIGRNYDIQVFIIGCGIEEKKLAKQIDTLGLAKNIKLAGGLDNKTVRNLYPLFDAFVLPSYSETFGIVYLEAMFAGLPVIGVKGQGIDGIIQNGIEGLLVNPNDKVDLAEKIEYMINNPDIMKAMASKGQKLVIEKYKLSNLIDRITNLYEQ
jgi:teichuronic acid biosynthesis glycosyltransferase TuaC